MSFSTECNRIFWANTLEYRRLHDVNATFSNPYPPATMQALLCEKNWIDNVQWDLEDIIRNPDIDPAEALGIKRRIDAWNQRRTDIVEQIDTLFFEQFAKALRPIRSRVVGNTTLSNCVQYWKT